MTSFVHLEYSTEHPGVARAERAASAALDLARRFNGARGVAAVLLAAMVSAVLVVANQLIETWNDGHLLAAWVVLWAVAFAGIALFAGPALQGGRALRAGWRAWARQRRQAEADRQYWEIALSDARVMAEISRAMGADAARDLRRYT